MTNTDHAHPSPEASQAETQGARTIAAARTGELVSSLPVDGLILSTANIYFTSHSFFNPPINTRASVWRTAQSAVSGQEASLYSEWSAWFGDIVFANVGGTFYGYFFATTAVGQDLSIKRVPLTGLPAGVPATPVGDPLEFFDIQRTHRNLVTDGSFLYWQDSSAVRKMPIGGGPSIVLDESAAVPNGPTAGLALRGKNLIYASLNYIRYVPTDGSAITPPHLRTIVTAASRVTALHAIYNGVYWGEESGAVKVKFGNSISTLSSTPGFRPTSISTNESTSSRAWSECGGSSGCRLQFDYPGNHWSSAVGTGAHGVTVTPANNVFWGDEDGVHRQVF